MQHSASVVLLRTRKSTVSGLIIRMWIDPVSSALDRTEVQLASTGNEACIRSQSTSLPEIRLDRSVRFSSTWLNRRYLLLSCAHWERLSLYHQCLSHTFINVRSTDFVVVVAVVVGNFKAQVYYLADVKRILEAHYLYHPIEPTTVIALFKYIWGNNYFLAITEVYLKSTHLMPSFGFTVLCSDHVTIVWLIRRLSIILVHTRGFRSCISSCTLLFIRFLSVHGLEHRILSTTGCSRYSLHRKFHMGLSLRLWFLLNV